MAIGLILKLHIGLKTTIELNEMNPPGMSIPLLTQSSHGEGLCQII